jgi:hypothetical protein
MDNSNINNKITHPQVPLDKNNQDNKFNNWSDVKTLNVIKYSMVEGYRIMDVSIMEFGDILHLIRQLKHMESYAGYKFGDFGKSISSLSEFGLFLATVIANPVLCRNVISTFYVLDIRKKANQRFRGPMNFLTLYDIVAQSISSAENTKALTYLITLVMASLLPKGWVIDDYNQISISQHVNSSYASMYDFVDDLDDYLNIQTILATHKGFEDPTSKAIDIEDIIADFRFYIAELADRFRYNRSRLNDFKDLLFDLKAMVTGNVEMSWLYRRNLFIDLQDNMSIRLWMNEVKDDDTRFPYGGDNSANKPSPVTHEGVITGICADIDKYFLYSKSKINFQQTAFSLMPITNILTWYAEDRVYLKSDLAAKYSVMVNTYLDYPSNFERDNLAIFRMVTVPIGKPEVSHTQLFQVSNDVVSTLSSFKSISLNDIVDDYIAARQSDIFDNDLRYRHGGEIIRTQEVSTIPGRAILRFFLILAMCDSVRIKYEPETSNGQGNFDLHLRQSISDILESGEVDVQNSTSEGMIDEVVEKLFERLDIRARFTPNNEFSSVMINNYIMALQETVTDVGLTQSNIKYTLYQPNMIETSNPRVIYTLSKIRPVGGNYPYRPLKMEDIKNGSIIYGTLIQKKTKLDYQFSYDSLVFLRTIYDANQDSDVFKFNSTVLTYSMDVLFDRIIRQTIGGHHILKEFLIDYKFQKYSSIIGILSSLKKERDEDSRNGSKSFIPTSLHDVEREITILTVKHLVNRMSNPIFRSIMYYIYSDLRLSPFSIHETVTKFNSIKIALAVEWMIFSTNMRMIVGSSNSEDVFMTVFRTIHGLKDTNNPLWPLIRSELPAVGVIHP